MKFKPSATPSAAAIAAAAGALPSEDRLNKIRVAATKARDVSDSISELEEELTRLKESRRQLVEADLPEMMLEAGMTEFVLLAEGNHKAVRIKVGEVCTAAIPKTWDPRRRAEAFGWLDRHGHGDLIKTAVSVAFPREDRRAAVEAADELRAKFGDAVRVDEEVHHSSLSAWLREQVRAGEVVPLDVVGGFIRRVAKMEDVD